MGEGVTKQAHYLFTPSPIHPITPSSMPTPLHAIQQSRLTRFGVSQCVDVHCHVLPGIDDGPKNLDESLTLCRSLMRDGITTVIATPHQLGRYDGHNRAGEVRQRVTELQGILD